MQVPTLGSTSSKSKALLKSKIVDTPNPGFSVPSWRCTSP